MPAQQQHAVFTGYLSGSTGAVAAGYVMTLDSSGDYYVVATSANRTAASRTSRCAGINITAGDDDNRAVEIQVVGPCPPAITGLAAGSASQLIVNASGQLERSASPGASDIVAGYCDADGWAYLNFATRDGAVASGSPGGSSTELQYRVDASTFGGLEGFTRDGLARLHIVDKRLKGGPAIDFADLGATGTLTRSAGNWTTDGFAIGDRVTVRGAANAANNVTSAEVTAVTSTVLTLNIATLTAESASSGVIRVFSQSYCTIGLTGGSYPDQGAFRSAKMTATSDDDGVLWSFLDANDLTIHGITHDWLGIGIGGSFRLSDLSTGVTDRASRVGVWGDTIRLFGDRVRVSDDRGAADEYLDITTKKLATVNATPVSLGLSAPSILAGTLFAGQFVRAVGPASADAEWAYVDGIKVYQRKDAGAASWDFNGSAVTGDAGGTTTFRGTGVGPVIPTRVRLIDGVTSVLHPSGNVTTIPDYNGTLPTSGGSPGGSTNEVQINNAGAFGGATNVLAGSSFISIGTNPASAGYLRIATQQAIAYRNAANSGDLAALHPDASNNLWIGCASNGTSFFATVKVGVPLVVLSAGSGTPAATGDIRLPDNCSINSITGGTDRPIIGHNGGTITVGDFSNIPQILLRANGAGEVRIQVNSTNQLMGTPNGVQLFSGTASYGGGVMVLGVANATTNPTTNPTGGGILYADAGAGKWRGSGGTVTTFGPADLDGFKATSGEGHCPSCGTDFAWEWANDKYGSLTVCMKCLTDELGDRPWIVRKVA